MNVGKYTVRPMDPMGTHLSKIFREHELGMKTSEFPSRCPKKNQRYIFQISGTQIPRCMSYLNSFG